MNQVYHGDCLEIMRGMEDDSVDMVMCSPPYENARSYGIEFSLKGDAWVEWALERYLECVRVCSGLVVWVVEGKTRNFQYSATPILLAAELHKAGVKLRKPAVFHRVGIAGSGGPDWLRNDWEFCICSSKGRLPWSDNTAMGHPPKWGPGGAMSHRLSNGTRRNQWGAAARGASSLSRDRDGNFRGGERPSHIDVAVGDKGYVPPKLANPGNVIKCNVGGGLMGSPLAHENEAPYPEKLVEFFLRSFCKPGGVVLDPFSGSGTTLAVAKKHGRKYIGIDCRPDQVELSNRRIASVG